MFNEHSTQKITKNPLNKAIENPSAEIISIKIAECAANAISKIVHFLNYKSQLHVVYNKIANGKCL